MELRFRQILCSMISSIVIFRNRNGAVKYEFEMIKIQKELCH